MAEVSLKTNFDYTPYPGCKGPITESFRFGKEKLTDKIFGCFLNPHDLISAGMVSRQFRCLTFHYLKSYVPLLKKAHQVFIEYLRTFINSDDSVNEEINRLKNLLADFDKTQNVLLLLENIEKLIRLPKEKEYLNLFYVYLVYYFTKIGQMEKGELLLSHFDHEMETNYYMFTSFTHYRVLAENGKALALAERGKVSEAFDSLFLQQIIKDPNQFFSTSIVLKTIIECTLAQNKIDEAHKYLEYYCLRNVGNFDDAITALGSYYLNQNDVDEAIRLFVNHGCFYVPHTESDYNLDGLTLGRLIIQYLKKTNQNEKLAEFIDDPHLVNEKRHFLIKESHGS